MAAAGALESWREAAPRRRRSSAARRPRRREAEVRSREAEPEADSGAVLRRLRAAEHEETKARKDWIQELNNRLSSCNMTRLCCGPEMPHRPSCAPGDLRPPPGSPLGPSRYTLALNKAIADLRISDFWNTALETINQCLREQLGQLEASVGTLSEALGNLHLTSPAELDVASDPSPGVALVKGACHFKCVCYGVGNFATCVTARTQLAFLLLFLEKCQIPRSHCWVYDPLFSQLETAVLHSLGMTVLSENEEGKRSVCGEPTVFYMLHCGTALYNNLLWSNWSADALSKMIIIGNSFKGLEERLLTRILQENYPYIAKVLEGLEELALPQSPQYVDTFNDTSVHWFPAQKLERLSRDVWAFREEPQYQGCEDLEIIRRKTADLLLT